MNDRNHLDHVALTHEVKIIENGLLEIPMLEVCRDGLGVYCRQVRC